jgi:hypothetical protein
MWLTAASSHNKGTALADPANGPAARAIRVALTLIFLKFMPAPNENYRQ